MLQISFLNLFVHRVVFALGSSGVHILEDVQELRQEDFGEVGDDQGLISGLVELENGFQFWGNGEGSG